MKTLLLVLLLFIVGCKTTPESAYSLWKVEIIAPTGVVVETYTVKSVDKPLVYNKAFNREPYVVTVNRNPMPGESTCTLTGIEAPATWMIRVRGKINECER